MIFSPRFRTSRDLLPRRITQSEAALFASESIQTYVHIPVGDRHVGSKEHIELRICFGLCDPSPPYTLRPCWKPDAIPEEVLRSLSQASLACGLVLARVIDLRAAQAST